VEVEVDRTIVTFRAGARYVELISIDGKWRMEVRTDYRTGYRFHYVVTVVIVTQDGKAYLSLETNKEEASALIRAMRGEPKNEKLAARKAKEILDAIRVLVGSILGPVLRP
jgi:hypothetical protein